MKKETLINCNNWFKLQNIDTFIHNKKIYLNLGNFEIELSKKETEYRANLYINLTKINR